MSNYRIQLDSKEAAQAVIFFLVILFLGLLITSYLVQPLSVLKDRFWDLFFAYNSCLFLLLKTDAGQTPPPPPPAVAGA